MTDFARVPRLNRTALAHDDLISSRARDCPCRLMNMRHEHLFQSSLIRNLRHKMVVGRHVGRDVAHSSEMVAFRSQCYHAARVNFAALRNYLLLKAHEGLDAT